MYLCFKHWIYILKVIAIKNFNSIQFNPPTPYISCSGMHWTLRWLSWKSFGRHFNFFLGANKIFLNFSMPPYAMKYWKISKKHHFICSNLTLFIVLFFLSFSFFLLFSLFFHFFFFFLSPWKGRWPPSPPQMTPLLKMTRNSFCERLIMALDCSVEVDFLCLGEPEPALL